MVCGGASLHQADPVVIRFPRAQLEVKPSPAATWPPSGQSPGVATGPAWLRAHTDALKSAFLRGPTCRIASSAAQRSRPSGARSTRTSGHLLLQPGACRCAMNRSSRRRKGRRSMDKQGVAWIVIGALMGALFSSTYIAFQQGSATGAGVLLVLFGVLGAVRAVQAWRRTGLPLATAGIAVAASSLIAAGSAIALGWDPRTNPKVTLLLIAVFVLIPGLLMFAESRRSPEAWRRWKVEGGVKSPLDYLTGRNIPHIRKH